jgi:hypothetical protein
MKKVCKNCKFYKEQETSAGVWIFKLKHTDHLCTHGNAMNKITGEPQDCSLVRILDSDCGDDGNWFEEKE